MTEIKIVAYPRSVGYFQHRIRSRVPGADKGMNILAMLGATADEISEKEFEALRSSVAFIADEIVDIRQNIDVQSFDSQAVQYFDDYFKSPDRLGALLNGRGFEDAATVLSEPDAQRSFAEIKQWLFPSVGSGWTVMAPHASWGSAYLRSINELTPESVLVLLAAAGIRLRLPSIFTVNEDARSELKHKLDAERKDYLSYVAESVTECRRSLITGAYKDVADFALWEFGPKLETRAKALNEAAAMQDRKLFKELSHTAIIGVPTIAAAVTTMQSTAVAAAVLGVLCSAIAEHWYKSDANSPPAKDIAYLLKLESAISST